MTRLARPIVLLLALLGLSGAPPAALGNDAGPVRIGVEPEPGDRRFDFGADLLAMALDAAGSSRRVERVRGMNQTRMALAVREGDLDVVMQPSVRAADPGLQPIDFPIRRGLLGVRLLLARPEDAGRIAAVEGIGPLKREFVLGYGQEWLDRRELGVLGFRIETASTYRGMFEMLRGGRFDYLSRGVNEIQHELADPALAGTGMVVVPRIALFYPLDDFFYLRADQDSLRNDITLGLQRLLDDGRYNRLLDERFGAAMRAANLDQRVVLHVRGYPVPDGTPLDQFDILQPVRSKAVFRNPAGIR